MGITSFVVNYLQLSALLFALDHYPDNVPKHWEAIAAYIELMKPDSDCEQDLETFTLTYSNPPKRIKKAFTGTANECKQLAAIIMSCYPYLIDNVKQRYHPLLSNPDRKSPLKPVILTPPISRCCDSNLYSQQKSHIGYNTNAQLKVVVLDMQPSMVMRNLQEPCVQHPTVRSSFHLEEFQL